ncbi:pre-mRNA-splicing factor 18-like [Littorina saxatilis]|uniref:Pre-mRNA-splicing factor 18 n=1 Tax=Littorina saxatilis TaxID=31220 RepID=A0AAN9BCS6_9CAEN
MDFMKTLKAEMERKKRQLQESDVMAPDKKYFKRGELAAKQTEAYLKKHFPQDADSNKNKVEEKAENSGKEKGEEVERTQQPRKEVIRKLRERGEPITVFGETHYESYMRLRRLEAIMPDISAGVGENDFQAAMEAVDQQYLHDIMSHGDNPADPNTDVSVKDDGTKMEDIEKMRGELGLGDNNKDQDIILKYFKFILKEWGAQLNARSSEEKRTTRGKMASATHTQTVSYLKPLFRMLKMRKMEEGLLESFVEIVHKMIDRNYIKANDSYLEMAIGNAPWPIGVTMVGIHARTGREKISSRYVAHVLNDETQRKYIQAVKRLMTQCQKIFPTDPSRSFNFQCPV